MAWSQRVYVATTLLGVYYTETFSGPSGAQPTWTAVNDGLPSTTIRVFALDPFDSNIQYCMLTNDDLYRRTGGTWSLVYSQAQQRTLCGADAGGFWYFCIDPLTEGRLWATYCSGIMVGGSIQFCRSEDRGESWTSVHTVYTGSLAYAAGGIAARGQHVQAGSNCYAGSNAYGDVSADGGVTWPRYVALGSSAWSPLVQINPAAPTYGYWTRRTTDIGRLSVLTTEADAALLEDLACHGSHDQSIWFDPLDADHMRILNAGSLRETFDGFATVSEPAALGFSASAMIGGDSSNSDALIVGNSAVGSLDGHVVAALVGTTGTPVGRAGPNAGSSPYTDSIPRLAGSDPVTIAYGGLQAIPEPARYWQVYSCRYEEAS